MTRIAIVNDMQMVIEVLRRIIKGIPGCEIAWTACNGLEAVKKCAEDTPDMMIMDLIMPEMNGVEAVRRIMRENPCPILIVTATVEGNSSKVFEALGEGALDAINTPLMDMNGNNGGAQELVRKISILKMLAVSADSGHNKKPKPPPAQEKPPDKMPVLVAIGSSTGGPRALADFFSEMPSCPDAAFVVVQHIDKQFAQGLASWLSSECKLDFRLIKPGDLPQKGKILLAATNEHMVLLPDTSMHYTGEPEHNPFRPSVDVFFNSLAEHWKGKGMAALMTGIGRDGAEGLLKLKKSGWHTFAQDRESSVVFGMPKAAAELNAAREVCPPREMAHRVFELCMKERTSHWT